MTAAFGQGGATVDHIEDIGLKGTKNSQLLRALSGDYDVFVTGDTKLEYQQNLDRFDIAIVLIHPQRLVVEQIEPLIPEAVQAFASAPRHQVTVVGLPVRSSP